LKPTIYFTSVESAEFENNTSRIDKSQRRKKINQQFSDTGQLDTRKRQNHTDERQKVDRISFLKVQKSGSSTVACIFIRFGINNNLSMFLPKQSSVSKKKQELLLRDKRHYNIFIIHTHYNYNFFTHIVHNPTIIGLIRRPETRLISHAFFFGLAKKFGLKGLSEQDFINEVVRNTSKYGVQNRMGTFFGLDDPSIPEQYLRQQLVKLNSEFTLVLILERLDESLVILKRLLRWSIFDIIYAAKKTKHHNGVNLNASQIKHLEFTNKVEYAIYNFFYEELERKIQTTGNDFQREVAQFKYVLNQTRDFCNLTRENQEPFYTFPASKWDDSFTLSKKDCKIIFKKDVTGLKNGRLTEI
jgi:PHD/YefM family antitoxin component YafN of YafNO toxin-antitoxin module